MELAQENLAGKTILEVGSGRGDMTRRLVALLENQVGAKLVVTDLSDSFFGELETVFKDSHVSVNFICADACDLKGVPIDSIDYLVCNYTLCAVNAKESRAMMALQRFRDVLKPGGWLLVEEEFPISQASNPRQDVWAEKWRILKAAVQLAGGYPFQEIAPEILEMMCKRAGFQQVSWKADLTFFKGSESLDFFHKRLKGLIPHLPNDTLRAGFTELVSQLTEKAEQAGGFEVPFYRLEAMK